MQGMGSADLWLFLLVPTVYDYHHIRGIFHARRGQLPGWSRWLPFATTDSVCMFSGDKGAENCRDASQDPVAGARLSYSEPENSENEQ